MDKCLEKDKFEITTGERIKALRKKRNVTIQQLADAMDLSRQTITNYEAGGQSIPAYTLYRLSVCLKCDLDYLLGKSELPTKTETDICKETGLTPQAVESLINKEYKEKAAFVSHFVLNSKSIIEALIDEKKFCEAELMWAECKDLDLVKNCYEYAKRKVRNKGLTVRAYFGFHDKETGAEKTFEEEVRDVAMDAYYQYKQKIYPIMIGYKTTGEENRENLERVLRYLILADKRKERLFSIQEDFLELVNKYINESKETKEKEK